MNGDGDVKPEPSQPPQAVADGQGNVAVQPRARHQEVTTARRCLEKAIADANDDDEETLVALRTALRAVDGIQQQVRPRAQVNNIGRLADLDWSASLRPSKESSEAEPLSLWPVKTIAKPSPKTRHERSAARVGPINHLQTAVEHQEPPAAVDSLPLLKPVTPVTALEAEARARSASLVKVSEDAGRLVLKKYENRPFSIRDEDGALISEETLDRHVEPLYEANVEFFRQVALLSIPLEVHRSGTYVVFRLYDSPSFFARHFIDVKSMRRSNDCFCGAVVRRTPSVCMQEAGPHCLEETDLAQLEAEKLHFQRTGPNSGPVVEALFVPTKVFSNTVSNARLEFIIPWQSRFERRVDCECQAIYGKRGNSIRYSDYLFTSDCVSQEPVDIDDMMPE